jgi:DDE_Tnp_1-associated
MLFIGLAATLCGAKSCVDTADFAAANQDELAEIVDLRHGAPSHDYFSRVFRLLDPDEMARAFAGFVAALRQGLDDARTRKNYGPQNLAVIRRIAIDILRAHPDNRSVGRKMKLAAWNKQFFFELFAYLR